MKIPVFCLECQFENSISAVELVELADSGAYQVECHNGHSFWMVCQQLKFQVLFELGANAILDGYYREAVMSFAASLERFYEFYLEVHSQRHGIPSQEFEAAWKHTSKQSERQLGAFIFVHTFETGRSPKLLPNSWTDFRNRVAHQGHIPTRAKAIEFGDEVGKVIQPVLKDLRMNNDEAIQTVVARHLWKAGRAVPGEKPAGIMAFPAFLDLLNQPVDPPRSVESWVAGWITAMRLIHHPVDSEDR